MDFPMDEAVKVMGQAVHLFHEGHYCEAFRMHRDFYQKYGASFDPKKRLREMKQSRIISKHHEGVAAHLGPNIPDAYTPHCICGWKSKVDYENFDVAYKVKCPEKMRLLKLYGVEHEDT